MEGELCFTNIDSPVSHFFYVFIHI